MYMWEKVWYKGFSTNQVSGIHWGSWNIPSVNQDSLCNGNSALGAMPIRSTETPLLVGLVLLLPVLSLWGMDVVKASLLIDTLEIVWLPFPGRHRNPSTTLLTARLPGHLWCQCPPNHSDVHQWWHNGEGQGPETHHMPWGGPPLYNVYFPADKW